MKRLVISGLLVAASFGVPAPAQAGPTSQCSGTVDVLCIKGECVPDYPCGLQLCVIYVKPDCL